MYGLDYQQKDFFKIGYYMQEQMVPLAGMWLILIHLIKLVFGMLMGSQYAVVQLWIITGIIL